METITAVLHEHISAETAHVTFDYPFGSRIRCVRREWVERATKGAGRGQQRFVTQTTVKAFNVAYTAKIDAEDQAAADAWAQELIAAGRVAWNKPSASIFSTMVVMLQQPLDDGSGRLTTTYVSFRLGSGPDRLHEFRMIVGNQLDEAQQKRLGVLEQIDRKLNPTSWAEYDQAVAA